MDINLCCHRVYATSIIGNSYKCSSLGIVDRLTNYTCVIVIGFACVSLNFRQVLFFLIRSEKQYH